MTLGPVGLKKAAEKAQPRRDGKIGGVMGHVERAATAMSLKLLSKCDGPYVVAEMPTEQNAVLTDPLTEERIDACSHGRTVAVDRLVLYPVIREDLPRDEEPFPEAEIAALGRMDLVAILGPDESIVLAQVEENHPCLLYTSDAADE